ncbi:replication initiation protein RepC (plasmid) [Rhizobium grahamii]|uniref:Replication initiation protein RepC n=1 Tax=Rhizobium grahamii TaxID=1120045 RepID=A0A5Q0CGT7_9HYPH|nr:MULTISPECIES: plasmid replication protein RepC [Rhizobium]QFY63834.1 replication initiation protein RepC [Rhizobium grahamii]QRM52922.1 replication initiation protein RepC [Rhizobium sp. BG6]
MDSAYVTTPFGRRPMTLGMLANQHQAETSVAGVTRNKWKLFRSVCEARTTLGVTDRALTVLDALLSFYPKDELSSGAGLVVFPSNNQLSLRARGMTPSTLRRHLAMLIEAGLILRKDSPNGKRYARRDREGEIDQAYGFSLAPLLAKAEQIEATAAHVAHERYLLRVSKERLTVCRRDVAKLITTALNENLPGDWETLQTRFDTIVGQIPRVANANRLDAILVAMNDLRNAVVNQLETHVNAQDMRANESQNERHIQDSHPESHFELERNSENISEVGNDERGGRSLAGAPHQASFTQLPAQAGTTELTPPVKSLALGQVLQACPQIAAYGPRGMIRSWTDLVSATSLVRTMLGISPSAGNDACNAMGQQNLAIVVACLLEKAETINSPGGYLRDLTKRAQQGKFSVGPMLMALLRAPAINGERVGMSQRVS